MNRREVITNIPPDILQLAKQLHSLRAKIVDMMRNPKKYPYLAEHINMIRENFKNELISSSNPYTWNCYLNKLNNFIL